MPFNPHPGFTYAKHSDLSASLREVELSAPIDFGAKSRIPGGVDQRTFKPTLSLSVTPEDNVALRIEELSQREVIGILAFGFLGAALGLIAAIISSVYVRIQVRIRNLSPELCDTCPTGVRNSSRIRRGGGRLTTTCVG